MTTKNRYAKPTYLIDWLSAEKGRGAYFSKVDPGLFPAMISKMKAGIIPITFEYAVRLERAQKASATPLRAELLMTFIEHRALYRYATGQDPAPDQIVKAKKATAG